MSSPTPTPAPAPGWYPDPAGSHRRRWWDGRGWTDHLADGSWDGSIEQPPLAAEARVNTPFIWIIALLPLLSAIAFLTWDEEGYLRRAIEDPQHAAVSQFTDPGYLLTWGVGFLIYPAIVVLAYFDWRALTRMGVVKPFHWAWSFLTIVYIIGRPVVLRRRVHQGLAPLWTFLIVYVLTIVLVIVKFVLVFAALGPTLSQLSTY
ncbi:MAG TPA: DUF2510 domain-containing protein [Amnibacterium sp.]|nr:DUF2510 domain-containing protein [Amnibacterium sp.]